MAGDRAASLRCPRDGCPRGSARRCPTSAPFAALHPCHRPCRWPCSLQEASFAMACHFVSLNITNQTLNPPSVGSTCSAGRSSRCLSRFSRKLQFGPGCLAYALMLCIGSRMNLLPLLLLFIIAFYLESSWSWILIPGNESLVYSHCNTQPAFPAVISAITIPCFQVTLQFKEVLSRNTFSN